MKRFVTVDEVCQWHELNLSGVDLKTIGKQFERDYKTIRLWFEKYNMSYVSHPFQNPNLIYPAHVTYRLNRGMSLKELSEIYDVDYKTLRNGFVYFGLDYDDNFAWHRKHPNHNFFSNIETEEQAYILGLIASDGHIEKRSYGSYTLKYSCHQKDTELTNIINQKIGNNEYNTWITQKGLISIAITSKQIGEDLLSLGLDNKKTYSLKTLPNIPNNLLRHFLRGFFDGDGCITLTRRKCYGRLNGYNKQFSIANYNKNLLEEILDCLPVNKSRASFYFNQNDFVIDNKIYKASGWTLSIRHTNELSNLFEYFYRDSNFYLKRKKDKFKMSLLNTKQIKEALASNS